MTYYVKRANGTATTDVRKLDRSLANTRYPVATDDLVFVEGVMRRVVKANGASLEVTPDLGTYYLAGPMRGYELSNFPAFLAAEGVLQARGFRIVSPAKHDLENGCDPSKPEGTPNNGLTIEQSLAWDFQRVTMCDGIILLDGWENSTGATAERLIAEMTKKRVYRLDNKTMVLRTDEGWKSTLTWEQEKVTV